ncbi:MULTISPECIES: DotU family type IV/VI secretion system protein [Cupriavidus]
MNLGTPGASLRPLMHDTALHIALLSHGAQLPPIHVWRARCAGLVETLAQALRDRGCTDAAVSEIGLAQCVLLDEVTLRGLPPGQRDDWMRETLQARFHAAQDGTSRVRVRIEALLNSAAPSPALLDCYDLVLELGFLAGRDLREAYRRRLAAALAPAAGRHEDGAAGAQAEAGRDAGAPAEAAAAGRELPVVLVIGPYAGALFAREASRAMLRRDDRAVWLRVDTPGQLAETMARVKASRGRFPDAALIPVLPEGDDEATLRHEFAQWQHALESALCHPGCVLPSYLAVYACLGPLAGEPREPRWFGDPLDFGAPAKVATVHVRECLRGLRGQLEQAPPHGSAARGALGLAVFEWLDAAALLSSLSSLANAAPLALQGVLLADLARTPTRPGAWSRWLVGRTGMQPRLTAPASGPLPVPVPVGLPLPAAPPTLLAPMSAMVAATMPEAACEAPPMQAFHAVLTPLPAAAPPATPPDRHARRWPHRRPVLLAATALAFGLGIAAWANHQAILRVFPGLLAHWQADGEDGDGAPAALMLDGRAFRLPSRPAVRIDSLSLFDSGKAAFAPGAAQRDLQDVLDLIRANPGQRVLIAGHADGEGSAQANFVLSEARARAIRDWFVAHGPLPVTRFAIQGYGDTRPVADNGSAAGRAQNRRVDIFLIPESAAR